MDSGLWVAVALHLAVTDLIRGGVSSIGVVAAAGWFSMVADCMVAVTRGLAGGAE